MTERVTAAAFYVLAVVVIAGIVALAVGSVFEPVGGNPHEQAGCTEDEVIDVTGRCVHIDEIVSERLAEQR